MLQDNKAWLQNKCLPRVICNFHYTTHIWAWPKPANFIVIHKFQFLKQYDLKGHFFSRQGTKIKNAKHIISLCFTAEISAK